MKYYTVALFVSICVGNAAGFQTTTAPALGRQTQVALAAHAQDRRQFVEGFAAVVSASSLVGGPSPAFADVSDGNALPQGAAQFGRILRAKSDMVDIRKRVAGSASEMDKKEWDNISVFLRKVYATAEDMKSVAGGFYDPDKKKKAATLIDDVKKLSKAADGPTGTRNGPEFLAYASKIITSYDEFLELLQDVPDEL